MITWYYFQKEYIVDPTNVLNKYKKTDFKI